MKLSFPSAGKKALLYFFLAHSLLRMLSHYRIGILHINSISVRDPLVRFSYCLVASAGAFATDGFPIRKVYC